MSEEEKITNAQQYIQGVRNSRDTLASILVDVGYEVTDEDKLQDLIDMFSSLPLNRIGDPDNLTTVHKETLVAAINELDANIKSLSLLDIQVVETLPIEDISDTTIYLVPKSSSETRNIYEEWLHVNTRWEKIGDTEVDLSNYATLDDLTSLRTTLETAINSKANQSDLNTTNTNVTNLTSRVSANESDIVSINNKLNNLAGIINATDNTNPVNLNTYNTSGTWLLVGSYYTPKNPATIGRDSTDYYLVDGGILRIVNDITENKTYQYLETINTYSTSLNKTIYFRDITESTWNTKTIPYINDSTSTPSNLDTEDYSTYSKTYLKDALSNKQETLVSGTNIKTIDNNSILGSGNLSIGEKAIILDAGNGYLGSVPASITLNDTLKARLKNIYDNFSEDKINLVKYRVNVQGSGTDAGEHMLNCIRIEKYDNGLRLHFLTVTGQNHMTIGGVDFMFNTLMTLFVRCTPDVAYISAASTVTNYFNLGNTFDLTTLLAGKQDTLVSGTNIKTVNGTSILGSGDISITEPCSDNDIDNLFNEGSDS